MSSWLIIFVGIIYAFIGIESLFKQNISTGIIFLGYAFSNIGLYMAAR